MDWVTLTGDPMAAVPWLLAAWSGGIVAGALAVALTAFYRGRR